MMLSLQILTPLCVRNGENASAITDYIHDRIRRVIYFIDQEKLNQWLMDQGESTRYLVKRLLRLLLLSGDRWLFFLKNTTFPLIIFLRQFSPSLFPTQ